MDEKQQATIKWSEPIIIGEIARQTLARRCVVLVDNCNWTGNECDVLAVTKDLRIIDIEVKISRSDLKADAKKDKWWIRNYPGWWVRASGVSPGTPRLHPPKVWKHYYALPANIWKPELVEFLPSKASGVLLLHDRNGRIDVSCWRRATPDRNAYRLTPNQVMDIARLANLRMWEAYRDVEIAKQEKEHFHKLLLEAKGAGA